MNAAAAAGGSSFQDLAPPPDQPETSTASSTSVPCNGPRWDAHGTPEAAGDAHRQMVAGDPVTLLQSSGVWRARLVVGGRSVEERLVVCPLPRLV